MRKAVPIELVDAKGTWHEIGRQYGEACADKIRNNIELWATGLDTHYKVSRDSLITMAQKFVEPVASYAPDCIDEIRGISEGANISFEEVFFLTAALELNEYYPFLAGGCTSFACSEQATQNGETIIGQNMDWIPGIEYAIVRAQPLDCPTSLLYSWAGGLGLLGINSAGLGNQANLLVSNTSGIGVPFLVLHHKILQQKNMAAAISVIFNASRTGSWNYLIASSAGDIVDIEVTKDDISFLFPENGIITHANCYLTERFKHIDTIGTLAPDGYLRADRMTRLMNKHHGKLSVATMKQLMQDHNDYPDSICRHVDVSYPPDQRFETAASIVSIPAEGKMYVTNGNPCENDYVVYSI